MKNRHIISRVRTKGGSIFHKVEGRIRNLTRAYEPEDKLAQDAQEYWNQSGLPKDSYHWRGEGIFEDEQRWLRIGQEHLDLIKAHAVQLGLTFPLERTIEWGCGGGMNAVMFAPLTKEYWGIDISPDVLEECSRQMSRAGGARFHPVLIEVSSPESVLEAGIMEADLFLCTFVYECLPTPEYGIRLLKLAHQMLKSGGGAFIHIRYRDGARSYRSRRWGYRVSPYYMTTYALEEFWNHAASIGFTPEGICLRPEHRDTNERQYAYFFLRKNGVASGRT